MQGCKECRGLRKRGGLDLCRLSLGGWERGGMDICRLLLIGWEQGGLGLAGQEIQASKGRDARRIYTREIGGAKGLIYFFALIL